MTKEVTKAEFFMKREEIARLVDAIGIIIGAGFDSALGEEELDKIDEFGTILYRKLKNTKAPQLKVKLTTKTWKAIMYVNGDLTITSTYGEEEDNDPEELRAIDLVNEFLIASARKLGRSVFRSPEDRKIIEKSLGIGLDLFE